MNCLQCNKPAVESGESVGKVKLRLCVDGHRTGEATAAMVAKSEKYRKAIAKAAKSGVFDYTAKTEDGDAQQSYHDLAIGE